MRKENNGIRNSPLKEFYIRAQLVYYNSSLKRNLKKKNQDKQKPERENIGIDKYYMQNQL